MDKSILIQYIDACELIKETEQDIERLRKKRKAIVQDSVKGSMHEFPYAAQSFHIEGSAFSYRDDIRLRAEERLLVERKATAEGIKTQVEAWMNTIPIRMQRIIRYKFFEGCGWEEVADRIGRKATGDSVRMEFERFEKK